MTELEKMYQIYDIFEEMDEELKKIGVRKKRVYPDFADLENAMGDQFDGFVSFDLDVFLNSLITEEFDSIKKEALVLKSYNSLLVKWYNAERMDTDIDYDPRDKDVNIVFGLMGQKGKIVESPRVYEDISALGYKKEIEEIKLKEIFSKQEADKNFWSVSRKVADDMIDKRFKIENLLAEKLNHITSTYQAKIPKKI